jgi:hypothetical protein
MLFDGSFTVSAGVNVADDMDSTPITPNVRNARLIVVFT